MTDVTKVGFILEVEAEDRRTLGDKLYGYDDLEAERELVGIDPHDDETSWDYVRDEMARQGVTPDDAREIQENQETVNNLLRNAQFDGHGVLFKTDGTNLGGTDEATEIPHFRHSAANCDDPEACKKDPEAGGVYRLFSSADLILEGYASTDILGDYKLRDDVIVILTGIERAPHPGVEPAERL